MAQHDYDILNADGATVRADINSVLEAIASLNSGSTAPSTTFPFMWWADTSAGILKRRNAANNAWLSVASLTTGDLIGAGTSATLTAGFGVTKGTLTFGTPTALDLRTAQAFDLTATGNFTLSNPTEPTGATGGVWYVDVTASGADRTITLDTEYDLQTGSLVVASGTTSRLWIVAASGSAYDVYGEAAI